MLYLGFVHPIIVGKLYPVVSRMKFSFFEIADFIELSNFSDIFGLVVQYALVNLLNILLKKNIKYIN